MSKQTAADVLIDTIADWGVDTIFGLPGGGINGIMEALRKRQDDLRFVQVRHEGEFATCVKYGLPVKVVVVKNNTLGQIKWEQMVFLGNPVYGVELQPINFAKIAEVCGGTGFTVSDPGLMGSVVERALSVPGPVLVEAEVDPLEPPMPPKITASRRRSSRSRWSGANRIVRRSPWRPGGSGARAGVAFHVARSTFNVQRVSV